MIVDSPAATAILARLAMRPAPPDGGTEGFGTGAHLAWDNAAAMGEDVMMRMNSVIDLVASYNASKLSLGRLEQDRAHVAEHWGEERAAAWEANAIRRNLRDIEAGEKFVATHRSMFGTELRLSGTLIERTEDGGLALGRFAIEGSGGGMAMRLDSEAGLQLKERGRAWAGDGGAAAARIAELRSMIDNRPRLPPPERIAEIAAANPPPPPPPVPKNLGTPEEEGISPESRAVRLRHAEWERIQALQAPPRPPAETQAAQPAPEPAQREAEKAARPLAPRPAAPPAGDPRALAALAVMRALEPRPARFELRA